MKGALNIAAKTRKLDVDNRLSLKLYYRTADNLLKQACVYREERNIIDLYILLLRFSSLVSETIPEHRDYRLYGGEKAEYKRKLLSVLTELESLKPEVQRQVDQYNSAFRKSASSSYSAQSSYSTPQADPGVAWPPYGRSQSLSSNNYDKYGARNTQSQPTWYGDSGSSGYNFASPAHHPLTNAYNSAIPSPYPPANVSNSARYAHQPPPNAYNSGQIEDRFSTLSLNIPRPKEETLSRHSILGSTTQRPRRESAPVRVQYPSYVDASPIELPSLIQNWDAPSQLATVSTVSTVSTSVASLDSLAEPVAWPNSGSSVSVDIAPQVSLIRQPSPPPVPAPVQTLQVALDTHDHPQTQIRPSEVADPRPGAGQPLDEDFGENKGPKHLHISTKMMDEFLRMAKANTSKNLETCGVLAGIFKKGTFYVSTLIIPKQEATSDSCQTVNEEEIFDSQDKRGLFQLGWIHTHPTQSCFMSSIDLHTHYSYQIMLQEAIAIVMAPTDSSRTYGIFRLADPGGVKVIQQCQRRGFHPHEEPPDGGPIYEHCAHVFMNPKLRFDVIDLRQS